MCGIAGVLRPGTTEDEWRRWLPALSDRMAHRGPDDEGQWYDVDAGVGLSHRRLSVIDPSPAGRQPMASASGRFILVYNGELYNFRRLLGRLDLAPEELTSRCDTEVLVEALEALGVAAAAEVSVGMFAFGAWDRERRSLHLVRDRMGVKPLYWGEVGDAFAFASELAPLRELPGFDGAIDREALALYFRHGYVPAPRTIYRRIRKLEPGRVLTVTRRDDGSLHREEQAYWSLAEVRARGRAEPFDGSPREAVDRLEALLTDAVRDRTVADVPLGAFLSGGIDSSTVVALLQSVLDRPARTFTIGFREDAYDEAGHARAVAEHLGTDHTELVLEAEEARSVIPDLPGMHGEPFADPSQIPTYLVSRLARRDVKVSLSGDGGDELFAGYNRYARARDLWSKVTALPRPVRAGASALFRTVPDRAWDAGLGWLSDALSGYGRSGPLSHKLGRAAGLLACECPAALYREMFRYWGPGDGILAADDGGSTPDGGNAPEAWGGVDPAGDRHEADGAGDFTGWMTYVDAVTYLPDDILAKVDRASMAVSLEARVPLLDHRVVEFAFSLPTDLKVRDGKTKWVLRKVLARHLPDRLVRRDKQGFGMPVGRWLRGPLRDWAEELLAEDRLRASGLLRAGPVRRRWEEHLSGRIDWQYHLWAVLMFQQWLGEQP